jgi:5,10-methylenetetrahydromethanopterin reductase
MAESFGYERIWFYDSPALFSDVWVSVARAAEQTERIGVGTGVLVPSNRHLLTTAAAIAGIEALAPGRLAVAIGTGFTARMMLGQKALPWKFVRRHIAHLKSLLRGEVVEEEGKAIKLCHPTGYSAPLPVATPILVAANGPKGLAVARELGDGVVGVAAPIPGFRWSTLLATGTVLEEGESFETPRVFDAIGPAIAVMYHGTYAAAGEAVDNLPGGKEWRESVEAYPEILRHFYVHEDHLVRLSDRERPFINPALGAATFTGTREQLSTRMQELEAAGTTELMYAPTGDDVERELRSMAEVAGL